MICLPRSDRSRGPGPKWPNIGDSRPAGLRRMQELGQTIEVDHEAEPNVTAYDALISLVDLLDGDGFDI